MVSFEMFFEKFDLNPKNWFRSPETRRRLKQQEMELRERDRKNARENIIKLKEVLKSRGYSIHKHDYSYTIWKDRKLGLSSTEETDPRGVPDTKYIRILFTLAHEVGHVLQWDDAAGKKENFDEFYDDVKTAEADEYTSVSEILHIQKLFYELDAWVKGMEFIPMELKEQYKEYAYYRYKTYMVNNSKYYNSEMILRDLLQKLNAKVYENK